MEIKAKYNHTKYGNFMFNLCASWAKFLVKHKILYYALSLTSGLIMTLIGLIIRAICIILKLFIKDIEFKNYNWLQSIYIGPQYWGGCSLGMTILRDHKSTISYVDSHEQGHSFQNCLLSILFIPLVAIPSCIRFWQRELKPNKKWPAYEAFWAEDSATQCGKYIDWYLNRKD